MSNITSERLKRLSPEIMDVWVERTLKEVKAANLQETLALRNSLPIYLSQLVDALSTTIDRTHARIKSDRSDSTRIGKKHGRDRAFSSQYTIDQLILEYHILRQVICDTMEKEQVLTPVEREVIVCSIEQAVNDAATEFSDTSRDFQDHLSHTLAHDLRNPLTTVKATAQMMRMHMPDEGDKEKVDRIIQSANRIDDMIQELLDEGRMKAKGKENIELKECDLDWLMKDVAIELNISHHDRFKVQSPGKCVGKWNANYLRRLIENLGTNAIKYSSENTPVTLSLTQSDNEAILKVHNLGNPIPKDKHASLFEKFSRLSSSEKKTGWGVGLAVVKGIVEAHKGTIQVESEEEAGTTFTIKIPKSI